MRYMLDTNICIYAINHRPQYIADELRSHNLDDFCISSITYAELIHGIEKSEYVEKNKFLLALFLSNIKVLDYDVKAADEYGKIRTTLERQGTPIGQLDLLIASHAIANNCILITNNEKEFKRVNGLKTENWIKPN